MDLLRRFLKGELDEEIDAVIRNYDVRLLVIEKELLFVFAVNEIVVKRCDPLGGDAGPQRLLDFLANEGIEI